MGGEARAAAAVTAPMLAERVPKMFALDAAGPAATGMDAVATTATYGLVLFATNEANELCDAHGDAPHAPALGAVFHGGVGDSPRRETRRGAHEPGHGGDEPGASQGKPQVARHVRR